MLNETQATPDADIHEIYDPVDDYFLVDESHDLRGRRVTQMAANKTLEDVGVVTDMLVDPETHRVSILELNNGRHLPIEDVRLRGSHVRIER